MHTHRQSITLHILSEVCGEDTFPHTCSPLSSVELDLLGSLSSGPTPCEHGWCSLCASCSLPASALYHTASHSLQQSLLTPQRGLPLCLCQPIKGHLGQDKLAYISQNYYTHDNKVMIIIVSQWLGRRWIVFGAVKFFGLQRFKHHPVHDNMAVLAWCGPVTDALEGQAIPALMLNRELRTAGFSPRVTAASEVAGQLCPSWEGRWWQILLVFSQGPLNPAAKIASRGTQKGDGSKRGSARSAPLYRTPKEWKKKGGEKGWKGSRLPQDK